jgi:putative endopeptidase
MKFPILYSAVLATMMAACTTSQVNGPDPLRSHIDSTVKPGSDFFLYANGKWFKANPIPGNEQSNGLWQMIGDTINAQIKSICESSAGIKDAEKGSAKQKIGDFYFSGMDSATINKNGFSDLKPEMEAIQAIKDLDGLIKVAAQLHKTAGAPFFNFYVGQDDKNSLKNAIFISQGGLSLPDRNYYFDADKRAAENRDLFTKHLKNTFSLIGATNEVSDENATGLMQLQTAMAKVHRKREDTRDPQKNYNKMSISSLQKLTPNINWNLFLAEMGLKNVDSIIIGQPEYLVALNGMIKSYSLSDWKNYFKYELLQGTFNYLDDKTYMEFFGFYSGVLRGVKETKPRWKRVVGQTNGLLGELIGQVYVAEYLPKGTKEKLMEIGEAIREVYRERIKNLDWMGAETKVKALKKLDAIVMKMGYPDKWKDMSALQLDRKSYVRNVMRAKKWSSDYNIAKFGKPVDRTEWGMQPQTYNAYYNPSNNEIVIPGCNIIVPGFERKLADDAILYSIIGGSTIGHEITHGFDDQGSQYDEKGNLNNWWTEDDKAKFKNKTQAIVDQFNAFIAVDSLHINGELTQGENIADLGGIVMGYEAFKKTSQFKNKEMIAGLSPDQRFFLGYAFAWMINDRPEAIANQVRSNEHSPAKFRVIGPLSNMPEFFATFGIQKGEAMWKDEKEMIRIW